ncbi:MAG: DUF1905 domain-containing protein [Saprospiraceae bacterium]|nr:DUF1905 domain-containing protein [Saprospiraceae bacterium]
MQIKESLHFTSTLEESTNKLWGCHFAIPPMVAGVLIEQREDRRVVCTLHEKTAYQCAMLPRGDGTFLITVNKKIQKELGLKIGSRVQVSLHPDESEYGLPMPEEMAEVLAQDEIGNRLFHALTPGKLRTLLYIVGKPKDADARVHLALLIVEHLKANHGKINYRQLGETMKEK